MPRVGSSRTRKRTKYAKSRREIAQRRYKNLFGKTNVSNIFRTSIDIEPETGNVEDGIIETTNVQPQCTVNQEDYFTREIEDERNMCKNTSEPDDKSDLVEDEYDFTWGSSKEYEEISKEKLEIEKEKCDALVSGYRIVNIDYYLKNSILLQYNHSKQCTGGRLELLKEYRRGLSSTFYFKCNICNGLEVLHSEDPKEKTINKAVVWGTLSTGSTFAHTNELLSVMDIPTIGGNMFFDIQRELGCVWKECFWAEMESAGRQELHMAQENGNIDDDGIPYITVLLDGGWSKRSYGHSYNAASGVAVIIGRVTGKLLFLGVRNKYCSICARAENKGNVATEHICFKNWRGSSTGMEPDIIVEGFNKSIELHGVRYKKFIADGDSTVFAHIRKNVSYGQQVSKIECTNHCIKNFSKHLYEIAKNKNIGKDARKLLKKDVINGLTKMTQKTIYANAHGDIEKLKEDLRTCVPHIFGHHDKCEPYLCDNPIRAPEIFDAFLSTGLHHHIYASLNLLISKAHLLIDNETNNRAELFMSILARFNMGKRLNLIQRDSFQSRALITGLSYNQGPSWHIDSWKKCFNRSPGRNFKQFMKKKENGKLKRKQNGPKPRVVRKLYHHEKNEDYGPNSAEIDMTDSDLKNEIDNLIERLKVTEEEHIKLSIETKGQFDNPIYRSNRMFRLTASNFKKVVTRKPTTSCNNLVKEILSDKPFYSAAIDYGKKNEAVAISKFEEKTGKKVEPSGLYVDISNGFLGASPDGIISETEIIEVKCLFKVANLNISLEEAVRLKQVACMEENKDGQITLKRKHEYFYQIQGQLAISRRKICYFVIYTGDSNDIFIEEIKFDEYFWKNTMVPKLCFFYRECLAPEIILNRRSRNLTCRDPPSIVAAQEQRNKRKRK